MTTIRNLALCILHFALAFAAALSGVAKTFDVDISTGRPAASNEAYYHGETIEFRAVRGRSVVTNVEYSCVYYQTNGMDSVWWHTDGLVFHPTNDVGAASYRFFLEGRDDLGRDWHANGLLRLLPSPGFTPNTIELPVARLDFAAVDVLNPPWTDPDYSTSNAALVETIEATAPAPGDYAAVSNAAVHAAITNALQDAAIAGKASTADATLTPIYSDWTILRHGVNVTAQVQQPYYADDPEDAHFDQWVITESYIHGDSGVSSLDLPRDAVSLSWVGLGSSLTLHPYTATRSFLGYRLGPDDPSKPNYDKPLASEAEAEALRAGKASVADATLTALTGFSDWVLDVPDGYTVVSGPYFIPTLDPDVPLDSGEWKISVAGGTYGDDSDVGGNHENEPNATEVIFELEGGVAITASRTVLQGYRLGPDDQTNPNYDKPLASETEAEALRAGKQDNLPYPTNSIPYAAISGKPTNVSAFNNDAGYLTSYTESDPTIKSWAKASTKPTYTASEVGAATAEDVYRIVAGTNVILVVTNYNSAVHAPAMKLQHLDPESGQYVTYWDEQRRHGMTLTNAMDYTDAAAAAELSRADAAYAPRAWSHTTSALGAEAPAGVTWISTPETVIAGGYEYEKVITTAGAVWVLTSNGLSTGATTNSYFRVSASDGTELFSIEKTDSYLVGVNATGITKSGNTVTIPVNVVAPSHPYIRATTNLVNAVWTKEDENGFTCPFASVSWSGSSGAYVATVTCSQPQAFFYFEFMQQGTAKIKNSAKTEMTGGIIFNGTTYMPTVNGNKLEFVAQ